MSQRLSRRLAQPIARTISRAPSPVVAYVAPWLAVMLGSVLPSLPYVGVTPMFPPLGFLVLLSWRQLRPGLMPVWAGFPLGLFDDLFSGQPFGSAILLWSATMLALDIIEARFPWRNFLVDWMVASCMIVACILLQVLIANHAGGATPVVLVVPQILLSVAVYPMVGRAVGRLDSWRLIRYRVIG
ncbi:rod shape-determining protein MreD [Novosphingobium sp. FSY-8]|uniref:Rod shape-determining protein MreD n=1 Tax=Novosphingobium ovatum TaxID=1908523 RepID=A0ABW9XCS4_9SPHN|nr:rod shape-determining protein MreD [Novosphingobium ovatum]NBC36318.1 rod shape-determining protein MreD [Novosphingobium ovatum]